MVEFNRNNIALLQKIKRLAKDEQGCIIHYDSPSLEDDLRTLVKSGVSHDLLEMIEMFLPTQAPKTKPIMDRTYRGATAMIDDRERIGPSTRVYRGRIISN
ncbi:MULTISPECIES: hypothetical protein [unclassified Oceanobacter]|uniref:hypothetical protein n=1 Tax=unclassified Oceanobacter TaxID=2620260 RepID=UPI0026E389A5|nr:MULTISPECIES: hypothetical protein [unclassified Oceanobacter]MDO6681827.1 hypothetical protein [Oceanobacter sp. 5_MG-2023]MDP2609636.1 hypothetical protein [Oceanobacter sp. 1_MG-2023]MDP2613354.1 hypothetical protein [Oceanobacter sp. 2_MG-2023]